MAKREDGGIDFSFARRLDTFVAKRVLDTTASASKELASLSFPKYSSRMSNLIATDLSSLYFEAVKDRLYADSTDGRLRKSAQVSAPLFPSW